MKTLQEAFDESLPCGEDQYWTKNAITSGGWIAYQPSAAVYHSHPDTYRRYFARRCNEERGAQSTDPSRCSPMGRGVLLKRLKKLLVNYMCETTRHKSFVGQHWDKLRFDVVRSLAVYKGRKHAESAK